MARITLALSANPGNLTFDNSASTQTLDQVRDEVLSDETLRAALKQVGPPPGIEARNPTFPTAAEIDFVRQKIQIKPTHPSDLSEATLDLNYTGTDAQWSQTFVSSLAKASLDSLEERATVQKGGAADGVANRLALAERYEQSARAALDDFLNRHFDEFNRLTKSSQPVRHIDPSAPHVRSTAPEAVAVQPKVNPKWQALSEQLSIATAELDRILLDRTLEHPQAKEAAVKVETLQRQLEGTPKYQESPPTARRGSDGPRWASAVQPVQFSQAELQDELTLPVRTPAAGSEYERLLAELRRAREERHAALREASLSPKAATPALAVAGGKIVANAHLAQTLREAPSTGRLTVLALISILGGASLATLIRNPRVSRVYASTAEIEADLALPVVCVLPAPVSPAVALSR